MLIRITLAIFILLVLGTPGWAQQVVRPEQCILDTLKSAPSDSAQMIRYNCVRQYIRAVEPNAVALPIQQFPQSTIQWVPTVPGFPSSIQEHVIVTMKNDSANEIIAAVIQLTDNKSGVPELYRLYADSPFGPSTVGTLEGAVITNVTDEKAKQEFWKNHQWQLVSVFGVRP